MKKPLRLRLLSDLHLEFAGRGIPELPPPELQHWAETTQPRPVTGAISVLASVAPNVQRAASPLGTARSVGQVQVQAKVMT